VAEVVAGFASSSRGQVHMACGTGKTLVGLWAAEELGARLILVILPSLGLVAQTLREWTAHAGSRLEVLAVCSDASVREDLPVRRARDLRVPVTTDPGVVARFLRARGEAPRVVFATYQSAPVLAAAFGRGAPFVDLVVADEAHLCAGPEGGPFRLVLDAGAIRARRRLFMTATPRRLALRQGHGPAASAEFVTMDDQETFGPVFYRLGLGSAIAGDLLSDYQVAIVGVRADDYLELLAEAGAAADPNMVLAAIALVKAMRTYGLRRTISFHSRVARAAEFVALVDQVVAQLPPDQRPEGTLWARHVSGQIPTAQRSRLLNRLRRLRPGELGLLANSRCLGVGIDVPSLDGVSFVDPRSSEIDVAQALGRAIRRSPDKSVGTVVLPVVVDTGRDPEEVLENSSFEPVWAVLRGLRAHDEEMGAQLDQLRRQAARGGGRGQLPHRIHIDLPGGIGPRLAEAVSLRLIEATTASWDHCYGLLEAYVAREGHALVPQAHQEEGVRLGAWVLTQRVLNSGGRLSIDRLAALESLPGWCWDARQAAWDEGFARLEAFVAREGHARPSLRWREDGFCLGHWVANQRVARRAGNLQDDRAARLETLAGWWWNPTADRWEEYFAALAAFCARSGHACPVQSHKEGDLAVGAWVARQRDRWRAGRLSLAHHERLVALPGWSFEVGEDRWARFFGAVEAFAARMGTVRMSPATVEQGLRIGAWVAQQRQAWAQGHLDDRRAKLLADLPGWSWQPHAEAWEDMYAALVAFVRREGHARVPKTHVEISGSDDEAVGLGAWVSRQRRLLAAGRLTPHQARRLSELPGWSSNLRLDKWTAGLLALDSFVAREHHAVVPQRHVEGDHRLGSWVGKQRCSRAEGTLAEERIRRLEEYPLWVWDTNQGAWDQGYAFLRRHVERTGHARVRYDHLEGDERFKLGQWCDVQRSTFRKGTLPSDRISRMEALPGWVWDVRSAKWEESFTALRRHVARTGTAGVPRSCVEDGFALGTWVRVQRRSYHDGSIEPSRISRLEALPGWTWSAERPLNASAAPTETSSQFLRDDAVASRPQRSARAMRLEARASAPGGAHS